ncbi:MAG: formylglycine-generating enzyme family protein [Treponemataceae bacterium]|nr:formylglycine-generating enzyme family protein [Treponemataceae bacterium]
MKKNVFNLILGSILCLNVLSCTINTKTLFEKDFVFVKGATIEGAIQAEGYPESYWFKAGAKHVIKDFYICNHEITQQEFAMYGMKNYDVRVELSGESIGPYYPAHQVNWFDVLMYCNRRSVAEGLTPCFSIGGETNPDKWGRQPDSQEDPGWDDWYHAKCDFTANGYRLPTIVEWEYAARGGNGLTGYQYKYAGSDILDEVAWYATDGLREVMQKKPNTLGIYDMCGNIEEWCWERYGNDTLRRYAGGYYYFKDEKDFVLSNLGYCGFLTRRNTQLGFRPVRNAE